MFRSNFRSSSVFLIIFSVLFLSSCSSRNSELKTKQSGLYFGAGTQSLMNKNYTEALTALLKANELDPNNSEILNNLGMAYYFKDQEDLAIRTLNRSLELNEDNSDAKVNLASIYYKRGEINKAEALYKKVLSDLTYDKQARTYYNLGIIEMDSRKNLASAQKYFQRSVKEDENFCPSHFQLGMINYQQSQFNSALRNFRESAMGQCHEYPAAHYQQALTLMKLRKYTDARMKFDEIDRRFTKTIFGVKARTKMMELNELEIAQGNQTEQATNKTLETPDF